MSGESYPLTCRFRALRPIHARRPRCFRNCANHCCDIWPGSDSRLRRSARCGAGRVSQPAQASVAGGSQANIRSWLFRVAHNRARNSQMSYSQRMGESLDPVFDTASTDASPEQAVLAKEKMQRVATRGSLAGRTGTAVPDAAGRRASLSRDRRSAGDVNLNGGRYG